MIETASGEARRQPAVLIDFDPHAQGVTIRVDGDQVKNGDMLLAVLEMAKLKAQEARAAHVAMRMQAQAEEAARVEALRRSLGRN